MRRDHEPAVWRDWFWSWWRLEYTRGALQPNCHLLPSPAQPIAYYKYLPLFLFLFLFLPRNLFSLSSVWLRRPISSQPPINSSLNRSWNQYSHSCFLLVLKILSLSRFLEDYRTSRRDCWSELRFDWFESSFSTVIERFALRLCIFDHVMSFPIPIADFVSAFWWLFAGWWYKRWRLRGRIERSVKDMDDREGSFVAVRRISQGLERGSVYNSSSGKIWSLKRFVEMLSLMYSVFAHSRCVLCAVELGLWMICYGWE